MGTEGIVEGGEAVGSEESVRPRWSSGGGSKRKRGESDDVAHISRCTRRDRFEGNSDRAETGRESRGDGDPRRVVDDGG